MAQTTHPGRPCQKGYEENVRPASLAQNMTGQSPPAPGYEESLSSELGIYMTVTARFWSWVSVLGTNKRA